MSRPRTSLLFALLAGALALSGCGSDDGGGGGAATPTTAAPAASDPYGGGTGGGQAGAGAGELVAKGTAFDPKELSFPSGGQISFTFTNQDAVEHNFTLEGVAGADKDVQGNQEVTVAFQAPAPGQYKFLCEYHPAAMTGTLTVT
jgi:plastocyanin